MFPLFISLILELRTREAIHMDMNYLALEYIWNTKKEEMKRKDDFRETYKLYQEFKRFSWNNALRRENRSKY
jgi:hypothetical protein